MAKQQTLVEDPDKITEDALNIIPDSNIGFIDQVDETVNIFNNYNLIFENQNDILNPLTPSKTDLLQEEDVQFDLSEEEYNSKDNVGDLFQDDGLVYPDIKYDNEVKKAEPLLNNAEIINRRNNLLKIAESQYIKDRGLENASLLTPKDKLNIRENASLTFRQELLAEDIYNKANKTVRYITSEQRADYEKKLNVADKNIKNYFSEVNIKADSIKGNIKEIDSRYDEIKNELNPIYNNLEVLIKKQKEIELNISTSKKQTQDQVDIINEELTTLSDKGSAIADREYLTQGTHDYAVKSLDAINSSINTLVSKRQLIIDGFNKLHNDKYVEFEDVLKLTRLDLNKIGLNEDGTVIEKSLTSEINNLKYSRDANIKAFEDIIYNSNKYSFQDEQEVIQLLKALDKEHDISKTAPKDLALSILGLGINTATWVKSLTIDPLMSAVDPMYKYKQMNLEIEIDEFFDNEQAKLRDPIAFRDIETTYDFADWFSHLATTQAPQAAVLFATRGLVGGRIAKGLSATTKAQKIAKVAAIKSANTISRHAGLSFLSASSAGATFREGKKAIRNGAEYSDLQLYMAGTMSFGAEYFSELYTSKMISGETFKVFKTAAFKKGFVGWAKNKFKTNNMIGTTLNLTGEGASEGFAEILGNNFVDRYIYGNKDVSLWSNVDEAFISGIFMAGAIYKMPMIAKDAINGFVPTQNLEVYALNKKEIDQLSFNISNNELTTKEIEIHEKRIAKLVVENNNLISDAIIVIDEMSNEDKRSLLDVELELNDAQNELEEISNLDKIDIVSLDIQSKIKTKIKDLKEIQNEITKKYYKELGKNKTKIIKNQAKKIYGDEVIVRSSDSLEEFQSQIELDLREEYTSGLEEGTQAYNEAIDKAKSESENRSVGKDALVTEVKQGNNKNKQIIYVNNSPELVSINVNAAAHEFLHKLFQATLKSNPSAARKISVNLKNYIDKIDASLIKDGVFSKRLEIYSNFYKDQIDKIKIQKETLEKLGSKFDSVEIKELIINAKNKIASLNSDLAEETMTLFSDALANKSIKYEESGFTKITDSVRRTFQDLGYKKIKFNTGQDVFNFIRDYNDAMKSGDLGSAFIKAGTEGVKGKLVDTKRQPNKKTSSIKYSKSFKDNVKRKFNNISEKDELPTRDAWPVDGDARKGKLALSIAGLYEGTLVSSLRPGQSQILQQSGRVEEFKEDAKTNLAMHILNFDSNKNDNVHGWINSQVANKAQDAIKGLGIELETFPLGETEKQIPEQQSETTAQERQEEEQASQNKTLKQNISVTAKSEVMTGLRNIVNEVLNDFNFRAQKAESTTKVSDFVAILKERIQGKKPGTAFKLLRKSFKVGNSTINEYRQNLIKNKEAILKGLTTSYLSRAFPPAIEKRIVNEDGSTKFVRSEEWLKIPKKNIGKKPGFIDIRGTKEQGYEGDTTGKQAMQRVKNIGEVVSDEMFLAKYIVNNKVPQMPSEMLMQQLAGEIGLDIFEEETKKLSDFNDQIIEISTNELLSSEQRTKAIDDLKKTDNFKLLSNFTENQAALGVVVTDVVLNNLYNQLERGTTKYSLTIPQLEKLISLLPDIRNVFKTYTKRDNKESINEKLNKIFEYEDQEIIDFAKEFIETQLDNNRGLATSEEHIMNNFLNLLSKKVPGLEFESSPSTSVTHGDFYYTIDGVRRSVEHKAVIEAAFGSWSFGFFNNEFKVIPPKNLEYFWKREIMDELAKENKKDFIYQEGKRKGKRRTYSQLKVAQKTQVDNYIKNNENVKSSNIKNFIKEKNENWKKENEDFIEYVEYQINKKSDIRLLAKSWITEYNKKAKKQIKNLNELLTSNDLDVDIRRDLEKITNKTQLIEDDDPLKGRYNFAANSYAEQKSNVITIGLTAKAYATSPENSDATGLPEIRIKGKNNTVGRYPGLDILTSLSPAGKKMYVRTSFFIHNNDIKNIYNSDKSLIVEEDLKEFHNNLSKNSLSTYGLPMDPSFVDANFANKKAIIVVGGIGSGKTTIINKIIDKLNLKELGFNIVDEDIERSKIQQDKNVSEASAYQNARKSVKKRLNDLSNNGDGIIYDNVGGNRDLTTKKVDELKSKGYDVSMILVDTNVEIAKKRDAARDRSMGDFMVEFSNGLVERRKDLYAKDFEGSFSIINTDNLNIKDPLPSNFLEQVKSNIKYSITYEELSNKFNNIIQETKGVDADDTFSETMASLKGADIGNYKFFVPPSADDFMGLMYAFMGKGNIGEGHKDFIEASLNGPYKRGVAALESAKQKMENDYKQLKKKYSKVVKKLGKKIPDSEFTYDQAIRVYLWKYNNEIFNSKLEEELGLSTSEINKLFFTVTESKELQQYARGLGKLTGLPEGYIEPSRTWLLETIASDLNDIADKVSRKKYLAEFVANKETIFSKENLNKIQAIYGTKFRSALEDSLYAMTNGTSRNFGDNKIANQFADWLNGSVGAIMFINARSAALQLISNVNYLNWSDNNLLQASTAFANQKQFWTDFTTIIMSDKLKQRRKGLSTDVQAAELANSVATSKSKYKSALRYLLRIGFTPTQAADAIAISFGGAAFYRNRINSKIKNGQSKEVAEKEAWREFSDITDATQQSADAAMVSQQQRNPLTRFVLAFQNTAMQYNRVMKKSFLDLVNRRGNDKENISKIIYYGAVQNIIFNGVQQAMFAMIWGDDESDEKEKQRFFNLGNGMIDTILRGSGWKGAVVAALKNTIIRYQKEEAKGSFKADHLNTAIALLNVAPSIGSKFNKVYGAYKTNYYERDVIKEKGYSWDSPIWMVYGKLASATLNIPADRVVSKVDNLVMASKSYTDTWQKVALSAGWSSWSLGLKNKENEVIKAKGKEQRKILGIEKSKATRRKNSAGKRRAKERRDAFNN